MKRLLIIAAFLPLTVKSQELYPVKTPSSPKTFLECLEEYLASVTVLAAVATTGNYNDLTNKPVMLTPTNNLSDVSSASTARTNLGLHAVAASGSYADLTNKPSMLVPANNLSDLTNAATARTNLGLSSGVTAVTGTNSGDVTTNPFGYATGAGGTVTQATNKSTGVTLNKLSGQITMASAALAANTTVTFTLTNSFIAATDIIVFNHQSGGTAGAYRFNAQAGAGSATINVRNITAGSLNEAPVIKFIVIKAVTN